MSYARKKHSASGAALFASLANHDDGETAANIDIILSDILVYCQFEIGTGAEPSSIQALLDLGTSLIVRCQSSASIGDLSPLAQRSAIILTSYDIRTSMFGLGSAEYTLRLAAPLFGMTAAAHTQQQGQNLSWHTAASAQSLHINFLTACCIRVPKEIRTGRSTGATDQVRAAMRQGDELYQRIVSLQSTFDPPSLDNLSETASPIDSEGMSSLLNALYMASVYNSLVVYLCRVLGIPPPQRHLSRIVNASRTAAQRQPDVTRSVFPRPLCFAALESKDPEEYSWIVSRLEQAVAAGAGKNVARMMKFVAYVRDVESKTDGMKPDLGEQLQKSGLKFIM